MSPKMLCDKLSVKGSYFTYLVFNIFKLPDGTRAVKTLAFNIIDKDIS
jgi:hypothetical protein